MRYLENENLISLSVRELVRCARRKIATSLCSDADEPPASVMPEQKLPLTYDFVIDSLHFRLISKNAEIADNSVKIVARCDSSPKRPRKETVEQARGEGFVTAFMLCEKTGAEHTRIDYEYLNPQTGERNLVSEYVTRGQLESFFAKCKGAIIFYATPEIERVTLRAPSMKNMKFPYPEVREGQGDIVRAVYRNVARGGTLFVNAPTGTGKTASTLFPALRALGAGKCEKIFYFTPKTTTSRAASELILELCRAGADIRAVVLSSKERLCPRGGACRLGKAACDMARMNKLSDAALWLYEKKAPVADAELLLEAGEKFLTCPHELSLLYSELCDVVICDLNYLFDPQVYIRRYFDEGGNYAFLIDEAHNLPDRARDMYTASIGERLLSSPIKNEIFSPPSKIIDIAKGAAERLYDILYPYVKEEIYPDSEGHRRGAVTLTEPPSALYDMVGGLCAELEDEIFKSYGAIDEEAALRTRALKEYYYSIKEFYSALSEFDDCYRLIVYCDDGEIRASCFCIDPSSRISKRLKLGSSATFFSGTLSPLHYYKSVLGNVRDADILEAGSPFDKRQLCVSIMDKISTRYSEREDTLVAVCRAIAATVSARRGNYMIFAPSFAYSEALYKIFTAKYPKVRCLLQTRNMSMREKEEFLQSFKQPTGSYLVGFSVLGGIYSEGVDFTGDSLIGAVIVGIGIPQLSYERELICAYYTEKFDEGKQFAYVYPGVNRVLQAAGRVIRSERDVGAIVLIDDRFDDPIYREVIPKLWDGMQFIGDPKSLKERLDEFWRDKP